MFDEVGNILFANSLIGTTIQDSGKRERSDAHIISHHTPLT